MPWAQAPGIPVSLGQAGPKLALPPGRGRGPLERPERSPPSWVGSAPSGSCLFPRGLTSTLQWEGRGGDPTGTPPALLYRVLQEASPETRPPTQGCQAVCEFQLGLGQATIHPPNIPANTRDYLCRDRKSQKEHTIFLVPGCRADPKHFWTFMPPQPVRSPSLWPGRYP